ncbi:alkene reductase [Mucilaginibacter sp. E4BP6]|uniref:alkene reductase n=1 Tax=Mucilaginibacter sp. E4BP6 TaxID=2723089 RepID=UPI0015CEC669|nr:alkene reductase [Mucilaginibacter sp. E4BP6]NYE66080.1 N-ethylmaleimide reductase [Mucilaginibacter sp. E4BP6]
MIQPNKENLLSPFQLGDITLPNRMIMASMTRARATNEAIAPNELHAIYYAQRAGAGLILSESVWVSKNAIGFLNIPGIFTSTQTEAWKKVTDAVHQEHGRFFLQLAHIGAASHPDYFNGELPLGPSAINPREKSFTPKGFKDTVTPRTYTTLQIHETVEEYHLAAINAKAAGFDGIELHAQLFTLIPQFLSTATNQRTDEYGGDIVNRSRILFEILDVLIQVFPGKRVAVKFTPAAFNTGIIKPDENTIADYDYLLHRLNEYDLAFLEIVGPAVTLANTPIAPWEDKFYSFFRQNYNGVIVANLGFNFESGNKIIADGLADLVSFATPFIANPDLVERYAQALPLVAADQATYYSGGEKGFTDYPKVTRSE